MTMTVRVQIFNVKGSIFTIFSKYFSWSFYQVLHLKKKRKDHFDMAAVLYS